MLKMVWNSREDEIVLYVGEFVYFLRILRGCKYVSVFLVLVLVGIVCVLCYDE